MGRYRDMTARATRYVPHRIPRPFGGRLVVLAAVGATSFFIVATGAGVALIADLARGSELAEAAVSALWGAVGATIATLLALIAMPFIRDALGLARDVRLFEAASPAHPLMRELMTKAPGTYTHSVATANLAESAAEAIGADPLVARVGAYYHDIGKIRRPCYFYENQQGTNPHDEAKPQLSALIITNHVTDGLALAEEYRLPEEVRAIIREHHGTGLVRYFYNKAAERDAAVYEADFRYQGEMPRSREAALVMLADASEAAVRAIGKPSTERVEAAVRAVIDEKIADHQLDRAGLDVANLEAIVSIYSRMLVSMYHARCAYPDANTIDRRRERADQHHQPSRA